MWYSWSPKCQLCYCDKLFTRLNIVLKSLVLENINILECFWFVFMFLLLLTKWSLFQLTLLGWRLGAVWYQQTQQFVKLLIENTKIFIDTNYWYGFLEQLLMVNNDYTGHFWRRDQASFFLICLGLQFKLQPELICVLLNGKSSISLSSVLQRAANVTSWRVHIVEGFTF